MAIIIRLYSRIEAILHLRPDQRACACETRRNNRKISFLPAAVRIYSLAMNPPQKQFSLTGVSLKSDFLCA